MIDGTFFRKFYFSSLILGIVLTLGSLLLWQEGSIPIGIAAGVGIGLVPFVSWHLALSLFLEKGSLGKKLLGIILMFLKYGLLSLLFYFLITLNLTNHWAILAGMLSVFVTCVILGILRFSTLTPGETH